MSTLGFVGLAHIHTPGFINAIKKRPGLKVKTVWDPNPGRANPRAKELSAAIATSPAEIFADPAIDAIIICSETNLHEQLVAPAVAAGKKLFVEKPLGYAADDAKEMATQIEKAGLLFQTGYFRRGDAFHIFLKDQITKGAFGKITHARASNCHSGSLGGWFDAKPADIANDWNWMATPKIAGCGAFGDLGTHMLDILIWLLGDVDAVTATLSKGTGRYGDCDELGEGTLRFTSGAIASLAAGWTDLADPVSLMISGTEGYAVVINGQLFFTSKHVEGADGKQPWTKLPEKLNAGFEAYLDALEGKKLPTLVTATEAAYRSVVMGAMYDSAAKNSWIAIGNKRK